MRKKSPTPSTRHPAVDLNCLLFNCRLSKSVAFQQSLVPKLLVAGLRSLSVMLHWLKIQLDLRPPPHEC